MRKLDFSTLDARDALDLAILIEEEAKERYEEFARLVGGRYKGDASDAFTMMAENEGRHHEQLVARRRALFGDVPTRMSRAQIFDVEAPGYGAPRVFMSPRQALEVALEAELKAADFYTQAGKLAATPDVKALFAELKTEEDEHAATLRTRIALLPAGPDLEEDEADEPTAL